MEKIIKSIIGGKIDDISRICNLISLKIECDANHFVYVHIQSFFRIVNKGNVIVSSEDMYRCGNNCSADSFNWDIPGDSLFDESIACSASTIIGATITSVQKTNCGDLIFQSNRGIEFQIFVDTTTFEEKYRVFDEIDEHVFYS